MQRGNKDMIFDGNNAKSRSCDLYVAPILGNGSLAFQVDHEGTMMRDADHGVIHDNSDMRIFWAGRRYIHKPKRDLISFGRFGQRASGTLESHAEILDTENAEIRTKCNYSGGGEIESEIFVHHDEDLIAVKKQTLGEYSFEYYLCGMSDINALPELMTVEKTDIFSCGAAIYYSVQAGMCPYRGVIHVFCDSDVNVSIKGNKITLTSASGAVFYILFCDNTDCNDYISHAEEIKNDVLAKGYDAVKKEHREKWQKYYREGYARIGDELVDRVYMTAQYHLKCYTTKWSVPIGLNNGNWHGKYFAFDEFYMLMGLLTSNHTEAAQRIPSFRRQGLHTAMFRASHPENLRAARYPWETLENGTEGSVSGFWHDHVFHMACIAGGAYNYYSFTGDEHFLSETAFPVIKACAAFYLDHMIYPMGDDKAIVGKCTDLERLGAAHENAYMTTCGVIMTLDIFSKVAEHLGVELGMARESRRRSELLRASLPTDGEKYIPYPGCPATSIGLLSGTYPFDVIARDDQRQWSAIEDYLKKEGSVGNMYATGSGVCAWYQTWKALVFARHKKSKETLDSIRSAAMNSGEYGEMYEINDRDTMTVYRPWFTTAAGMLVHAVNEMLLQRRGDDILIGAALPENVRDFSFKLATDGNIVVEAEAQDGKMRHLKVSGDGADRVRVVLPGHIKG